MVHGSSGVQINLMLGENGEIISIVKTFKAYEYPGEVNIISAEQAYEKLKNSETIDKPLGNIKEGSKITDIRLGYKLTRETNSYLTPIWIFSATIPPHPGYPPALSDSFRLTVDATKIP